MSDTELSQESVPGSEPSQESVPGSEPSQESVTGSEPSQESVPGSMSTNEDDVCSSITEHTDDCSANMSLPESSNEVDEGSMDDSAVIRDMQSMSAISDAKRPNESDVKLSTKRIETVKRRQRKQRMPQRCDRSLLPTSNEETQDEGLNTHESSFESGAIDCNQSVTCKSNTSSPDNCCTKQQFRNTGFHLKRLHRPYFMKGGHVNNKFTRSHLHKCMECCKKFPLKKTLMKHISRQHAIKLFQCRFCSKLFQLAKSLKVHIKREHSRENHQCVKCDQCFTSKLSLKQHWKTHSEHKASAWTLCHGEFLQNQFHCDVSKNQCKNCVKQSKHTPKICQKFISSKMGLYQHQTGHCGNNCCSKSRSTLKQHSVMLAKRNPYTCQCGMLFDCCLHLKQHVKLHPGQEHYEILANFCKQCDLNFADRSSMLRHMQIRHRIVLLVCPLCNMQFNARNSLRKHLKSAHGMTLCSMKAEVASPKFTCTGSNVQMLQSDDSLPDATGQFPLLGAANHMRGNVDKVSAYPLEVLSGKQYSQMAKMYPQIAKLLKCPYCDTYYRLKGTLRKHISDVHVEDDKTSVSMETNRRMQLASSKGSLLQDTGKGDDDFSNHEINDYQQTFTGQKCESLSPSSTLNFMDQTIVDDSNKKPSQKSIQDETQLPNQEDMQIQGDNNNSVFSSNSQGSYLCSMCNSNFTSQHDLDSHVETHPCCPLCLKQYVFRDSLRKHIKRSHPEHHQKLVNSKKKSSAEKAIQIASEGSPPSQQADAQPVCATCNLGFDSQVELKIHEAIHPKCPRCPKQYTLKDSLRKHIKRTHPVLYSEMVYDKRNKYNDPFMEPPFQKFIKSENQTEFSSKSEEGEMYHGIKDECLKEFPVKRKASEFESKQVSELVPNPNEQTASTCTQIDKKENGLQNQNQLACPYCSKQYCLKDSLRQHIRRTHGKHRHVDDLPTHITLESKASEYGDLVCSACSQNFDNWQSFQEHKATHARCEYCSKLFVSESSLRKHMCTCDKQRSESLSESPETSVLNNSKDDNNDRSSAPLITQSTSQNSSDASYIVSRKVEHHQSSNPENGRGIANNVFPCTACMIIFDNQDALDFHIQTHLACQFCGKLYTLKDSLRRHIKRSHPNMQSLKVKDSKPQNEDKVEADESGSSTDKQEAVHKKEKLTLEHNQETENGDNVKNLCPVCFLVFDNDEAYEVHAKIHPTCEACGKMYRLKDSLKKHIQRSHPALYMEIQERKQDQADLRNKKQTVNNDQDCSDGNDGEDVVSRQVFSCPACQLIFDTEELLDDHVATHPACIYCGKAYKLIDSLRKHIKRSHANEEFKRQSGQHLFFSNDEEDNENLPYPTELQLDSDCGHSNIMPTSANEDFVDEDGTHDVHSAAAGVPVGVVYPCPAVACSVIFNSKNALAGHVTSHYSCIYCGKLYSIKSSFLKHMQRSHPLHQHNAAVTSIAT